MSTYLFEQFFSWWPPGSVRERPAMNSSQAKFLNCADSVHKDTQSAAYHQNSTAPQATEVRSVAHGAVSTCSGPQ